MLRLFGRETSGPVPLRQYTRAEHRGRRVSLQATSGAILHSRVAERVVRS